MGGESETDEISVYRYYTQGYESFCLLEVNVTVDGTKQTIDMRRKRSMEIYKEIIAAIRGEDLNGEFKELKRKAEVIAKPYLKWV